MSFPAIPPDCRHDDPQTSRSAGEHAQQREERMGLHCHKARLLRVLYLRDTTAGSDVERWLTDVEIAQLSGVGLASCWWKRCSELRDMGFAEWIPTGEYEIDRHGGRKPLYVVRPGSYSGEDCHVQRITEAGRAWCVDNPAPPGTQPVPDLTVTERMEGLRRALRAVWIECENHADDPLSAAVMAAMDIAWRGDP